MGDCEIRKSLAGNGEILPAGAIYLPMKIGKEAQTDESGLVLDDVPSAERSFLESKLKRNGIFLDDEEILRAQDPELNGEYIPKYSSKKTDVFVSAERFEEIYEETKNTIVRICEEMLSGDASAKPFGTDGKHLPCEYCGSRALCRRRK
jgi:ATP-dependent helicase/DNAse subunit B